MDRVAQMQANPPKVNLQEQGREDLAALIPRNMDNLALTWSIGIGLGYVFLIAFACWIGYRCFLVCHAFMIGDIPSIMEELKTDLLICAGYLGIAILLRKKGII